MLLESFRNAREPESVGAGDGEGGGGGNPQAPLRETSTTGYEFFIDQFDGLTLLDYATRMAELRTGSGHPDGDEPPRRGRGVSRAVMSSPFQRTWQSDAAGGTVEGSSGSYDRRGVN